MLNIFKLLVFSFVRLISKEQVLTKSINGGGGHWGVLNTAIPQKNLPNTAILQYPVETRRHTETATLYIKFRANNTETEIKIWKCSI